MMPRVAAAAAASPLRKMARTATAAEGDLADAGWDNAALAAAMEEAEETSDGAATTAQQPPPEAASSPLVRATRANTSGIHRRVTH
eukprot:COSAG01_NODE_32617_length_578_cov_1.087683_1_plen_86_part_00